MKEECGLKGKVTVTNENGTILWESDNLILNTGLNDVISMIGFSTAKPYSVIALGDNNTGASGTQTDLQGSEIRRSTTVNSYAGIGQMTAHATFEIATAGGEDHYEAVFANADSSSGNRKCLSRVVMGDGVHVDENEEITYTWEVTVV